MYLYMLHMYVCRRMLHDSEMLAKPSKDSRLIITQRVYTKYPVVIEHVTSYLILQGIHKCVSMSHLTLVRICIYFYFLTSILYSI